MPDGTIAAVCPSAPSPTVRACARRHSFRRRRRAYETGRSRTVSGRPSPRIVLPSGVARRQAAGPRDGPSQGWPRRAGPRGGSAIPIREGRRPAGTARLPRTSRVATIPRLRGLGVHHDKPAAGGSIVRIADLRSARWAGHPPTPATDGSRELPARRRAGLGRDVLGLLKLIGLASGLLWHHRINRIKSA